MRRALDVASRRLLRVAAPLALALAVVPAAAAQEVVTREPAPDRPRLEVGADTNDWQAYYKYGLSHIRRHPDRSAAAFYWASRLAPDRAEPLYARWVTTWMSRRGLLTRWINGTVGEDAEARAVDSLQTSALLRDPFVHQGLERLLQGAIYDRKYGAGEWGWEDTRENQGWIAYTEGKFDRAAERFAQAIRSEPTRAELRVYRARALYGAQQYDSAAAEMTAAIAELRRQDRKRLVRHYDSKAMYEYSLGVLHTLRRDYPAARAAYGRAIEEDLTFHMAHAALGGLAFTEGDTTKAISAFQDAVTANPADPVIRHDLGVLLVAAGRPADALEHFRRAIALAPDYAVARFNYALALEATGRAADAAEQYAAFAARASNSLLEASWAARGGRPAGNR